MTQPPLQLVWFKRDLRLRDHAPLLRAAQRGRVLPLYILEDEQLRHPEFGPHHYHHLQACLRELQEGLARLGAPLLIRRGEALAVLKALHEQTHFQAMWAHQETGNWVSYQRSRRVRAWAKGAGLPFFELPQNGVVRRLKDRDAWAEHWEARMGKPPLPAPAALCPLGSPLVSEPLPSLPDLGMGESTQTPHQAGEEAAGATLQDFLGGRAYGYQRNISAPLRAQRGSSRLSAHLAYGSISLRTVVQASRQRRAQWEAAAKDGEAGAALWVRSLKAFESRLYWHCHFIQRLESQPRMEFEELHPAFAGLRDDPNTDEAAAKKLLAWQQGQTGYPMIDACMRSLKATGWLNFRMRAMLVSFASHHLWLPWQTTGLFLARQWIDNEPGIHWAQMQMQSGTVGINRLRIYSPTVQAREQDPSGEFIRQWVPEVAHLEGEALYQPWRTQGALLGPQPPPDYPAPIVPEGAGALARARLEAVRAQPEAASTALSVFAQHGSRLRSRWSGRGSKGADPSPAKGPSSRSGTGPSASPPKKGVPLMTEPSLFGPPPSENPEGSLPAIRIPGLPPSWQSALEPEFSAPYFHALKDFLVEERQRAEVYPPASDVFNALRLTPLEEVKVLILGQDPYHGPGQAHGLSFSVRPGVRLPPSLRNIYQELQSDLGIAPPRHGFLQPWAEQGVLLLNAVLTVRRSEPNSHAGQGWERLTDTVIRTLNAKEERVVFILWGAYARKKKALVTAPQHVILESAHPSPYSADKFFGTRPFSAANAVLREVGREEVNWALPEQVPV